MKQVVWIVALLIIIGGCSSTKNPNKKPVILVSILPQKTFVEKIAGDDFQVEVLIPHGASPATYSLLPSQMTNISGAVMWFRIGYVGFELSWADKIIEANSKMEVVNLSEGISLIVGSRDEKNGKPVGVDPHIWLSPVRVKKMAQKITDELVKLNPKNYSKYQAKMLTFIKEIEETDIAIREEMRKFAGSKFISYHPSLSYFALDYQLVQLSLEQGGKEATVAHMADLVKTARDENIKVIYIQSDFDKEGAQAFAGEIGGEAIQIWPLAPEWSENMLMISHILSDNFR
ncbi:MAG: zinc ABC transporter substrate-binding protein [Prolixibacteraceae bacterium]|nr:zinc ABC transporter substrate-binding protein [Prolixibacteraceae bacterium]